MSNLPMSSDTAITFIADNTQHIRDALSYLDQQQLSSLYSSVKKAKNDRLRNMTPVQIEEVLTDFHGPVTELIFLLELYEEKEPGQAIAAGDRGLCITTEPE